MTSGDSSKSKEIWRPVKEYEGLYEVSNYGNIKSLPKYNRSKSILLHPTLSKRQGRYSVMLTGYGGTRKRVSVHRIVAFAFVDNPDPDHFTEVNHKDENPRNNEASNLEWCDRYYNMHYNNLQERIQAKQHKKPVCGIKENGDKVRFDSMHDAKIAGFDPSGILQSIKKPLKTGCKRKYKGYSWEYENKN